nr:hypothetical protein [Tanacetum cinerariifolium]
MIWHAIRKCMKHGKMQHPVDGRAWKNFDTKYPDFAKEPRNVRLGLAAVGFNPFGNLVRLTACYKACPTCNKDTPYVRVLRKTTYVGHRRFLKKPHKWRSSREFNGQTDNGDPPKEFGRDEILAQLDRLPMRLTGKHPSFGGVKIKRNVLVELSWTKRSIFYVLEYWSFLTLRHNLYIMRIEKNMLEAILNTLLMNEKSKYTVKARQDLQ